MATHFHFKAIDRNGRVFDGTLSAEDESAVTAHLHHSGALPVQIGLVQDEQVRSPDPFKTLVSLFQRPALKARDLADWCDQIAALLKAGLALDASLTVIGQGSLSPHLREFTTGVQADVRQGLPLSVALLHHQRALPPMFIPMVQTAEMSGSMGAVLSELGDELAQAQKTREALYSALTYPVTLLVVALLSMIVVITVVLPALATMFDDMDATLPVVTRATLAVGSFLRNWGWLLIFAGCAMAGFGLRWLRDARNRRQWDGWLLSAPLLGPLVLDSAIVRFSRILGMLLEHGVTIDRALPVAASGLGNTLVREHLDIAAEHIKRGNSLSTTLTTSGIFGGDVQQLLRIGEESGALGAMLLKISARYERRRQQRLTTLLSILEPVLILSLACLIGIVVISLLMAILSINDLAF